MNKEVLALVEDYVLGLFRRRGETRVLAREIFDSSPDEEPSPAMPHPPKSST